VRKHLWYVRPGYLAVIGGVLAAFMVAVALLEMRNSRDTMLELIAEKGRIVANQIEQGAVLAMRAMEEAEAHLASRLLTLGRVVARMEQGRELGHPVLAGLAEESGVQELLLVSPEGLVQVSSRPSEHSLHRTPTDYPALYPALFKGDVTESILGMHSDASSGGEVKFSVGVRRRGGGAVICSVDEDQLLDLRKTFGLGRLIQDVGEVRGMSYVMIQDEEGILTATRSISGARRVLDDPFLSALWADGGYATRTLPFEGRDVFEVVKTVSSDGERFGLLRVAFELDEIRALEQKSRRRLSVTIAVLSLLGMIALNAVVIYQNMNLAVRARDEVSTFSGAVLSGMADGVLVVSEEGTVALANDVARSMFGKQIDLVPEGLKPLVDEAIQKDRPTVQGLEIKGEDGRQRYLTLSASRVRVPGEEAPYTVLILRDVTEEQRLRDQIQRSERITALGRLAAAVAHEVRNPLNAIGMTAQRLRAEFEPREGAEEYGRFLDVIRSEIGRLDDIITQFLRFASEPRTDLRTEDLAELVASVITEEAGQAAAKEVRLTSEVAAGQKALVDARQMRQVLLNLVSNAIEAMEGGGDVRITARQQDEWVEIVVEDKGSGMTSEELDQALELHFTTKDKGTGLGLPISQRIVERHGGALELESRKGVGTKATIRIPREGGLKA
jgi:PAS domain S-box-containing protein